MSSTERFDRYGDTYAAEIERATGGVGDSALFTQVKVDALLALVQRFLGSPGEVSALDVGCGPGLTDACLDGKFKSLTGVDVSSPMLEQARQANPTARYDLYDGHKLPYSGGSFDLAFAICVLHHIEPPDRPAFAAEVARVVRRGGLVVLIEHNPLNPLTRAVVSRCEFDEGVTLVANREAKRLLSAAGADVVESRYILFFPWRGGLFRRAERPLGALPLGAQFVVVSRRA